MKTVLLFGGSSDEKMVSVASAQNLARCFDFAALLFWRDSGEMVEIDAHELATHENPFQKPFQPQKIKKHFSDLQKALPWLKEHVVFIGLHGTQGEDGQLQKIFEENKVSFTGSGSEASALCFCKNLAKEKLRQAGLRVPQGAILNSKDKTTWPGIIREFAKEFPQLVLKPAANGSSFGLQIVRKMSQLESAIQAVVSNNFGDYLLEEFVSGRELTTGVYETEKFLQSLPASEVIMNQGFEFDYQGKYLGVGSKEITPAQITKEQMLWSQELAKKAHETLGCRGYSRTDMILTEKEVVFIETNTLPGMTKASFYPQQLEASGIAVQDFVQSLILLASR